MNHWIDGAVFYHLYPLGALGAPPRNDFASPPADRIAGLHGWLDRAAGLGASAIYLGPVFESTAHGYDTADYFHVDRRLGDDDAFARFCAAVHERGLRLVLDGVFHHVGRDFWAFRDVRERGAASPYRDWFHLDFNARSPYGDPFSYAGWSGHLDLVKLRLENHDTRAHLLAAVESWMARFAIDGLRLDAADALDLGFQRALAAFCRARRPDFWFVGEVVHGDYRRWAHPEALDSVTNYEAYKGLYSSLNDTNYFEIAYALERQSRIYAGLSLYTFVDNHDVDRIASRLADPAHLYPLHIVLFTMPGVPAIYYGSERGIAGKRSRTSDAELRPALAPEGPWGEHRELEPVIHRLVALRRQSAALRRGQYRQLHVAHEQLAFARTEASEQIVVAVNAAKRPVELTLALSDGTELHDLLNEGKRFPVRGGRATLPLDAQWGRVLALR